ncbi:MAG TPA: adenine phosphoribosyltransferase [Planctomycetota bacterium]|nr:adenine phosphoribosyltransferase [Planctomycetota bacterium]
MPKDFPIEKLIRDVPDFPKPGILFKDITPLLQSPEGLAATIALLDRAVPASNYDVVCGIESRGFIFGSALALKAGKGFVPIRKPGKLPYKTAKESYELEYGRDSVEIHIDALSAGQRVLIVDDLLATGGTMAAAAKLVKSVGGQPVAALVVIELEFLKGRARLGSMPVHSLIRY